MASISPQRLHKELSEINIEGCPAGAFFPSSASFSTRDTMLAHGSSSLAQIISTLDCSTTEVLGESLYQGEVFKLM
ncbi:hypothetical protein PISMIDRAFT_649834 [Pisolithus microcarpus 441]|uniref:Uncharacterized protein n=1 Tax=Pisolithus microcarpus 441 TaxID=765257 RepID=A0A0C9YVA7_9AGAM|nr:hypothetical protein PISMIDRAFT_649834 [Pisolithus microcarpus 441]